MGKIPVNEIKKASKPAWLLALSRFLLMGKIKGKFFPHFLQLPLPESA
jgi:hypothetical protein